MSNALVTQNGVIENRVVQSLLGKDYRGYLMGYKGPALNRQFYAMYTDGTTEEINPITGYPRPAPDTAVKSKGVIVPTSWRTADASTIKFGGRFTGMMRRFVQCDYSRGRETKFSYTWQKTHGILEYPEPRHISSTANGEKANARRRRFWIIEISASGLYAAPIEGGSDCFGCSKSLSKYFPSQKEVEENPSWAVHVAELSLHWAYENKNSSKAVQRVLTAEQVAVLYSHGSPWYSGMGWAFSISGKSVANVVAKDIFSGLDFNSATPNYYETRLITISLAVQFSKLSASAGLVSAGVVQVVCANHTIQEGGIAVISGATQPEYNGAFVAFDVTGTGFKYNITGSPTSPATGDVKVSDAISGGTISALYSISEAGKVTFKRGDGTGGTLWYPETVGRWVGVYPHANSFDCDGPVHVYYDGEQQIVTRWGQTTQTFERTSNWEALGFNHWSGSSATGVALIGSAVQVEGICQAPPDGIVVGSTGVAQSLFENDAYTQTTHGFYGDAFDLRVTGHSSRGVKTADTTKHGPEEVRETVLYGNHYGVWEGCSESGYETAWAAIEVTTWQQAWLNIVKNETRSKAGLSTVILFLNEREAIAGIKQQVEDFSTTTNYQGALFRSKEAHVKKFGYSTIGIPSEIADEMPFTDYEIDNLGFYNGISAAEGGFPPNTSNVPSRIIVGDFTLNMVGAYSYGLVFNNGFGDSPDLLPFTVWNKSSKETADSALQAFRGGLYHATATLTPPNQLHNRVVKVDNDLIITQGFVKPADVTYLGFVGEV